MDIKQLIKNSVLGMILLGGLGLTWMAMQPSGLTPQQYMEWVKTPGNGYYFTGTNDYYKVEFLHQPETFSAIQKAQKDLTQKGISRAADQVKDYLMFSIRLHPKTGEALLSPGSIEEDIQQQIPLLHSYIHNFIQDNIILEIEGEALECDLYHFENGANALPFHTMIIGFKKPKDWQPQDMILKIQDDYLDLGLLQAGFQSKEMKSEPALILR